jgi:hypothetical protein
MLACHLGEASKEMLQASILEGIAKADAEGVDVASSMKEMDALKNAAQKFDRDPKDALSRAREEQDSNKKLQEDIEALKHAAEYGKHAKSKKLPQPTRRQHVNSGR